MQGERDGQTLSPSPSMLTDETTKNDNNSTSTSSSNNSSTELAYLPIGCSVSAKYRGAFCSAQVKTIEKQVKLKVTLVDSGDTITISEEQIVHSVPLRIGNTVTIRLASSNRRQSNDSNSNHHYSRSGLAAFINPTNPDEKQATIKQIIDNSIYTVIFNDGDERSLRRSSLCLQGIRLYQTQYGQQKILEEIPTSTSPPPTIQAPSASTPSLVTSNDTTNTNANDITSIVAVKRHGNSDQQAFPALILKRKALADYMWVRSFVDGREYIVHTRDDAHPYHNNSDIQALCRSTSKQATQACEKFIKYNHIPAVWHKKKKKQQKSDDKNSQSDAESISESDSSSSESEDDDEIDEETTEEKDSFVAQLFAFMDDRGTPINNIPKVQNYDLDLHRLFKIVRMLGGYNKVTKNDQWSKVHIKMGLPDELSSENGRSIEHAYKKYLFAYEDLSKKLGSMNAPSAYFGGRTSLGSDSRRSLIRVRQQQHEEEKNQKKITKTKPSPAAVKQRSRKSDESRPSTDTKPVPPPTKKSAPKPSAIPVRKGPNKMKSANILSSSTSESESESDSDSSDNESNHSSSSAYNKTKAKPIATTQQKKPAISSSAIPKKVNQISSSTAIKPDVKKVSTNNKPTVSSANDSKQSKLTITIPIAKSKTAPSTNVQQVKKTNVISSAKDEKKKVSDTKSVPIKTEPKTIVSSSSSSLNKKTVISTQKTSQLTKANQKQSSNSTTVNKPSSTVLPFKPKTVQSQTSTNNNNNNNNNTKERSGLTKPTSSSVESRQIKQSKINSSSVKAISQERSLSAPVKKTKPTINEETITKPISSAASMKIPKISANNDSMKKSTATLDKIPKKQVSKETTVKVTKTQDNTPLNKSNHDQPTKAHSPSPTRPVVPEPLKPTVVRDPSPLPLTPVSPSPSHRNSLSSISDEPITSTILPNSISSLQSISSSNETTPEIKPIETSLLVQSISILSTKESTDNEMPSLNPNKRPHSDETSELINISDISEPLTPSKRLRRSISSQESIETFSTDQPSLIDYISANRNTQLTYEDISINDVLLVTWGTQGTKQYPARCIEKNDEKKELLVHYTGWNSRHDEWIKLDRVIERKDSTNANTVFQQRPRRTSQINSVRQHLDSTNSTNSIEQNNQPQITNSLIVDISSSSATIDDDEQNKIQKTISIEKPKIEESDIDDNSQGQSEMWNHVETISSTEDDALSCSSTTTRANQLDLNALPIEEIANIRRSISTTNNENNLSTNSEFESPDEIDNETESTRDDDQIQSIIPKRRQSRAASSANKVDPTLNLKVEQIEEIPPLSSDIHEHSHQYPLYVKEETIDSTSVDPQSFQPPPLPPPTSLLIDSILPSTNILPSPPATATGNRRASVRQQKRRSLREPSSTKDSSLSAKKKKLDNGNIINTDMGTDYMSNIDQTSTRSNSTDQQFTESTTGKRYRPPVRRGGKRSANQQEYENEDYRSNSPSNITMRQQLKDMFKHRPSRYNFLDLNNNLAGDERITHLKDRMRECQKVFFNLKSALVKIEKQRKIFVRKQKPIISTTPTIIQTSTTEILGTTTCT
ncbi:unnamed protein product [Rotaria socialis]|uniref:ARID domain-containing protein n=1 Tax=Rotaria socialis TaxID=392032 RepID=A0A820PE44_9BILA|nr:unnamed protein product [Rotaria socialis]CAF4403159.1 unnamed protein product [Rotaria socialis]